MKYFITTTDNAVTISQQEAMTRGCGPVTRFWWGWTTKWDDDQQAALCFDDSEEVPPECEPTVNELPPDWYAPGTVERAAAEERERGA